jgi:hypothetical protein
VQTDEVELLHRLPGLHRACRAERLVPDDEAVRSEGDRRRDKSEREDCEGGAKQGHCGTAAFS